MVRRRIALVLAALVPIAIIAGLIFIVSSLLPKPAAAPTPTHAPSATPDPGQAGPTLSPTALLALPPTYTPAPTETNTPTRTTTPTRTAIPPTATGTRPTGTPTKVKLPCLDLTGSWTGLEWVVDGSSRLPAQYEFSFVQDKCRATGSVTVYQDNNNSKEYFNVVGDYVANAYYFTLTYTDPQRSGTVYKNFILFVLDENNLYSGKDTSITPGYVFRLRKHQ